jgi:hypothetical protein
VRVLECEPIRRCRVEGRKLAALSRAVKIERSPAVAAGVTTL